MKNPNFLFNRCGNFSNSCELPLLMIPDPKALEKLYQLLVLLRKAVSVLLGFLMFLLLALVSHYVNPYLPEHPYPLLGIKQIFCVVSGLGKSFFIYNIIGIISCIIRKF